MTASSRSVPITILTGFLGSGKTTLLNRILSEANGERIAVIENEFGEIGIDQECLVNSNEEIIELNNGCICCTVRGDLIRIVGDLLNRREQFDRIIIETTGVANPSPIIQTFLAEPNIAQHTRLDGVVTVVDCFNFLQQQECKIEELVDQIAFADVLLLNKTDMVPVDHVALISDYIRSINVTAKLYEVQRCDIPVERVMNIGGFDLTRALQHVPNLLAAAEGASDHDHHHTNGIESVAFDLLGEIDFPRFQDWFVRLISTRGSDLYRCKGILAVRGEEQRLVFHGVHALVETQLIQHWGTQQRRNQIIFIGRHLNKDELKDGIKNCLCKTRAQLAMQ